MLLRQIKYFIAVVDTGSFTEAAEECFISQSAISQQILSLEKELSVQLLKRSTRRFTLTAAGKYLYGHGKQLVGEVEKLKDGTIKAAVSDAGYLTLGYLNTCADERLYKAVTLFKQQNAGVNLTVTSGSYDDLASLLTGGRADIIFSWQRHVVAEGYAQKLLASGPVHIKISAVYGGFESGSVEFDDLNDVPCILVADEKKQNAEKDFFTKVWGYKGQILFARTAEEAHFMVAAGNGFCFTASGQNRFTDDGVRGLSVLQNGRPLEKKYYLCWKKDNDNDYIRTFIETALKAFGAQNGSGGDL